LEPQTINLLPWGSADKVAALLERLIGLRERAARPPERIAQRRAASGTLV